MGDRAWVSGFSEDHPPVMAKEESVVWEDAPAPAKSSPLDKQVGGDHYKNCKIQAIEFIQANNLSFCEGSAIKYITRHRLKGKRQDLEKAIHYLELEIAHTYG